MPRIDVRGHVRYDDLTSATGATVRLRDLDRVPGHPDEDDRLLTATTDARGRFAGRTTDWRDREGRALGLDVPDVLRLEFTVTIDGRSHSGPFLQHGGASVPIVLPFGPRRPVGRSERELVQIVLLAQDRVGAERKLYEFVELSSETLTQSILGDRYRRITSLTGSRATLPGLVAALRTAATRPGTEAVDLLFTTHGDTNEVFFHDGVRTDEAVAEAVRDGLPTAAEQRLRTVFSTACFGRSHLDGWLAAGFTDASGARGVYADSAVSYAPFLLAWAGGNTFAESVDAANAADVNDAADGVARAFYEAKGEPGGAAAVDSTRVLAGTGASRLYSTP